MATDLNRRIALLVGGAAVVASGVLATGCSTSTTEAPTTGTPTGSATSSSAPTLSPTEKQVAPLTPGGPNSFTPTVNPRPPGPTCTQIVGNNCVR